MAAIARVEALDLLADETDDAWEGEMRVMFDCAELAEFFEHFETLGALESDDDEGE